MGTEMYVIRDLFLACPPVYTLPGTWNDPEKIALCNDTLIPHFTFNPDYTFMISIAVITILLAGYGVYKGFFANKGLSDPWDDHDDWTQGLVEFYQSKQEQYHQRRSRHWT